jgi:hypothetical protein
MIQQTINDLSHTFIFISFHPGGSKGISLIAILLIVAYVTQL